MTDFQEFYKQKLVSTRRVNIIVYTDFLAESFNLVQVFVTLCF